MLSGDNFPDLVDAVCALNPEPRQRIWRSLSFCVLDSVFSIGARYSSVVRTVGAVAHNLGIENPSVAATVDPGQDPLPLAALLDHFPSPESLAVAGGNRQRTSTRGGILKADAALQYAQILIDADIDTLAHGRAILDEPDLLRRVEDKLRGVPGEGSFGVRRGYLWMLVGNDNLIKPDRMVLRWLADQGIRVDPEEARMVLTRLAESTSERLQRTVTPWEIDHAIWLAARR